VRGEVGSIEPGGRAEHLLRRETACLHDYVVVSDRLGQLSSEGPFHKRAIEAKPPARNGEGSGYLSRLSFLIRL